MMEEQLHEILKRTWNRKISADEALDEIQDQTEQNSVTGFVRMSSKFMGELAVEMHRLTGSIPDDDPFELRDEVLHYLRSLPKNTGTAG